jgi:ankyrin repeat protein
MTKTARRPSHGLSIHPGYPDNVSTLTQSGAEGVNRKHSVYGQSALSFAAKYGLTKIAQILIRVPDLELDSRSESSGAPLAYAAWSRKLEIVRMLAETGQVDAGAVDANGTSTLMRATKEGHVGCVGLLMGVE